MALYKIKGQKPNRWVDVPGGGGGTMDHAALTSNLAWPTSGHTGTANYLAGFNGSGAAANVSLTLPLSLSGSALSVNVFTGDSGSGGTTGIVPAPAAGDGLSNKFLSASGVWALPPSGYRLFYMDPSASSDISGYKKLLIAPSTNPETTLTVAATGTGDNLLEEFATEPGIPGVTLLPAGVADRTLYVKTGAANQVARILTELYKRTTGGTETLLRSKYTSNFSGSTVIELSDTVTDSSGYSMNITDRLVLKLYAARVSGPTTCDITVYFDGANYTSHIQTTITDGVTLDPDGTMAANSDNVAPTQKAVVTYAQPKDADLTAIAALTGTGFPARTASDTWALRSLSAPAAGFTITNPAGVAGNPTFALANDLSALEAMSGTGLVVRTGSETYAQRTITNGGGVTITNGDGVSGNPTISVSPNNESALNAAAFSWFQLSTDGVTVYATLGSATSAGNGSFNVSYNNTGTWPVALLTATNASSYVLIRTSQRCSLNQAGTYQSQFKSGPTTTAIKYWLGLSASITAASKPTGATACVVYDSAISANWQLITYDGTAGSAAYTDMGVALAANTQYEVEIVFTSTSATARIRLTGGTWSTPVTYNSTNIPAANAKMYGVGLLMARTDSGAVTSNWFGTSYHSTYQ